MTVSKALAAFFFNRFRGQNVSSFPKCFAKAGQGILNFMISHCSNSLILKQSSDLNLCVTDTSNGTRASSRRNPNSPSLCGQRCGTPGAEDQRTTKSGGRTLGKSFRYVFSKFARLTLFSPWVVEHPFHQPNALRELGLFFVRGSSCRVSSRRPSVTCAALGPWKPLISSSSTRHKQDTPSPTRSNSPGW